MRLIIDFSGGERKTSRVSDKDFIRLRYRIHGQSFMPPIMEIFVLDVPEAMDRLGGRLRTFGISAIPPGAAAAEHFKQFVGHQAIAYVEEERDPIGARLAIKRTESINHVGVTA